MEITQKVVWYGPKHVPSTKGAHGTNRLRCHPFENEYLCPVQHEGHTFPSAFHAYSAAKSTRDPVEFTRGSVRKARELGKGYMVPGFVDARERVMRSILRSKFFRDPALARALLATGTDELRYDARNAPFWGYPGENAHGKILADLRLELVAIIEDRRRVLEAEGAEGQEGQEGQEGPERPTETEGPEGQEGPEGPTETERPEGPTETEGPEGPGGPEGQEGPMETEGQEGPEGPEGQEGPEGPTETEGPGGPTETDGDVTIAKDRH